ncbi:MAG: hypothetical protein Q8L35_07615 [Actinomycetota bacterium]|nr:hypothetical protein [Actinomycetota bacterium]
MASRERVGPIILRILFVAAAVLLLVGSGVSAASTERPGSPLDDKQKAQMQMAINLLKLTNDADALQARLKDGAIKQADLNDPPPKDPADRTTGQGWPDQVVNDKTIFGTIIIDTGLLSGPEASSEDTMTLASLVGMNDEDFEAVVRLAEALHHENIHNQQQKKRALGEDAWRADKTDTISNWGELEAYYGELLWKLRLKQLIGETPGEKPEIMNDLIGNLVNYIGSAEYSTNQNKTEFKPIERLDASPTVGNVYDASASTSTNIGKVQEKRDMARQKLESLSDPKKQSQSQPVDPGTGGMVVLPDGNAWVTIPGGGLTEPTVIEIDEMDMTGLPNGLRALSSVFRLDPDGTEFDPAHPAVLTIKIDPAVLDHANIYYWNPGARHWDLVDSGRAVWPDDGTISVTIAHFSYYIVVDDSPTPVPVSSPWMLAAIGVIGFGLIGRLLRRSSRSSTGARLSDA